MKGIAVFLFLFCFGVAFPASPQSFGEIKDKARRIYQDHQLTFYCGCSYTQKGKKGTPDLQSCGYQIRKDKKRATRIEWEHVVPAWELGHSLQCWKEGTRRSDTTGRKHCRQENSEFWLMYSNLHNLVPAIGEVNGDRSNFSFTILEEESNYGECEVEIKRLKRQAQPRGEVEPPEGVRGAIARIYLYMLDKYQFGLDVEQQEMFREWNES
jgi:deoxyribonuclease-1